MKKKIAFALLLGITAIMLGASCKKPDYSPISVTSFEPRGTTTFQSYGKVYIKWRTYGATKNNKRVAFIIEVYVKGILKKWIYLQPSTISLPESKDIPVTENDTKEEFKINLGPEFMYKNATYKLRGIIGKENSNEFYGGPYWEGDFTINHDGCDSQSKNEKSKKTNFSCAITGIPRVD